MSRNYQKRENLGKMMIPKALDSTAIMIYHVHVDSYISKFCARSFTQYGYSVTSHMQR